nr:MAG TPA: hypothetical protein [Caudoviricetes sp.]
MWYTSAVGRVASRWGPSSFLPHRRWAASG